MAEPHYHDPSVRELMREIAALRQVIDERDRLYRERDEARRTAVDAALMAVKEQTKQSFEASEKAIVKAEEAQKAYNSSHNDLARKMDEQNKGTMPRTETEARFNAVQEKVDEVRNAMASGGGVIAGGKAVKDESRSNVALVVAFAGVLLAVATAVLSMLNNR